MSNMEIMIQTGGMSLSCLENMLVSAEFKDIESWKLRDNPNQLSECRGICTWAKNNKLKIRKIATITNYTYLLGDEII